MAKLATYRTGFLLVLLLLSGCVGSNFNWDKVQQLNEGMTQDQVRTLMGRPNGVMAIGNQQIWSWVYVNGVTGTTKSCSVVFQDGKLFTPRMPTTTMGQKPGIVYSSFTTESSTR